MSNSKMQEKYWIYNTVFVKFKFEIVLILQKNLKENFICSHFGTHPDVFLEYEK